MRIYLNVEIGIWQLEFFHLQIKNCNRILVFTQILMYFHNNKYYLLLHPLVYRELFVVM